VPAIDTPLLVTGRGPAVLVAAKSVSAAGLPCVVAGHRPSQRSGPVELDDESIAILTPHGVLDVLRPYASNQDPFTIAPTLFEAGLKHHCVADMLITVLDDLRLVDPVPTADGQGVRGVLSDGRARWELRADAFLDVTARWQDAGDLDLNDAIHRGAAFGRGLLGGLRRGG
jgi:hypothetical protein